MRARGPRQDAIVIGAGFFGIEVALEMHRLGMRRILVVEREPGIMRRASYVNQARVHNGYHYPRSLATAERSRANFEAFVSDYREAVLGDMAHAYAIARGSRVSGPQFETFCRMIGAPCRPAPPAIAGLFDPGLIEAAFMTREVAFDSSRLAARLQRAMDDAGIVLRLDTEASVLGGDPTGVDVAVGEVVHRADHVFNCTYADIERAGVALRTRVKKELAEMVLVVPPPELRDLGVTVMDGPFFSTMPFPAAALPGVGVHSVSHVRYTPHCSHTEAARQELEPLRSNREAILRDSRRYLPCLGRAEVVGSVFEVKATLLGNEDDDGRPILIERSEALPRVVSILGAKIDNIYDVRHVLRHEAWAVAA